MSNYNYHLSGVPDIDQRWEILPGGGGMYCFPTSVLNWMYYLQAKTGWQLTFNPMLGFSNREYNLLVMGNYMDTDAKEGTSLSDLQDGAEDWLDDFNIPANVCTRSMYSNDGIGFNVLKNWSLSGGLMTLLRAKYSKIKTNPLILRRVKKSGHMVTIVGLKQSGSNRKIVVHDPAQGDNDKTKQSNRLEHTYPITSLTATYQKYDYEDNSVDEEEYHTALRITGSTDPYKIIEGYSVIFPAFTITNSASNALSLFRSNFDTGGTEQVTIPLPFEGIGDIAIKPGFAEVYVLQTNNGSIWKVDLATREVIKYKDMPGTTRLLFGGTKNHLYTIQKNSIIQLDNTAKELVKTSIDKQPEDVVYDYKNSRLVALVDDKAIHFSDKLQLKETKIVPVNAGSGKRVLITDQRTGRVLLSTDQQFGVLSLQGAFRPVEKRRVVPISATQPNMVTRKKPNTEPGRHLVVRNGLVQIVNNKGEKRESPFNGVKAGSIIRMSGNHLLVDPKMANSDEYRV